MPKTIEMKTSFGDIIIELDMENTPITANNFLDYINSGFYNETIFHRVIPGFVVQGGGMLEDMSEKQTNDSIKNEANKSGLNIKGSLSMARTPDPDSASSQFFINLTDNNFLNHTSETQDGWGYCVFAKVVEGLDIIEKIGEVKTTFRQGHSDVPIDPVSILSVKVQEPEHQE